jgi:CubicO group peptidase (beta-lactamase class C family)
MLAIASLAVILLVHGESSAAPQRKRRVIRKRSTPVRKAAIPDKLVAAPKLVHGKAHGTLKAIDQMVLDHLKKYKIPGATVAVTKGGRLVLSKGYGYANANQKIAMLPTHRTRIGSVSKLLTTSAVMKLHEIPNGFTVNRRMYGPTGLFKQPAYKIAMNAAIAKYKPNEDWKSWYLSTRIKHLLSHSAGWERSGDVEGTAKMFNVPEDQVTPRQVHLHFLTTKKLLWAPGSKFKYSNRSIGVMDHVIQTVSGKQYQPFVKQHVLLPIGLNRVVPVGAAVTSLDASPHDYINNGTSFTAFKLPTNSGTGSAGGWRATAKDLARFMVATDQLANHSDILKPQTLQLMETRPFPNTVPSRALGWGISVKGRGKKLSHGGLIRGGAARVVKFTPGYVAADGTKLDHVNVAICVNIKNNSGISALASKIANACGKASIPVVYDLFQSPSFKVAK